MAFITFPQFHIAFPFRQNRGASLIEIIVATAIVGTVLTAIAASMSMSLRNSSRGQAKVLASDLAQEVLELYRRERKSQGWGNFLTDLSAGTYCFDTLPTTTSEFSTLSAGECGATEYVLGTRFIREAVVTPGADSVLVIVLVEWQDGDETQSISVQQTYRSWD